MSVVAPFPIPAIFQATLMTQPEVVEWTNLVRAAPEPDGTLVKADNGIWSGASSTLALYHGDGYAQLTPTYVGVYRRYFGLTNAAFNASPSDIQFGMLLNQDGGIFLWEGGFGPFIGAQTAGVPLYVKVQGSKVRYYSGETLLYSNEVAEIQYPLRVDGSLEFNLGDKLEPVRLYGALASAAGPYTDGPLWTDFLYEGPEFNVYLGPKYEDGSRDRNVVSTAGTHKWTIDYESLTEAEQVVLDAHYQSAVGPAYGFNFCDHRQGAIFSNCHYESYKRAKGKTRARGKRKVVIICEPT